MPKFSEYDGRTNTSAQQDRALGVTGDEAGPHNVGFDAKDPGIATQLVFEIAIPVSCNHESGCREAAPDKSERV